MGAFNTVEIEAPCPNCGATVALLVQFKYADCWQHHYMVGDVLRWGGQDIGSPGSSSVVVDGAGEPCPRCGSEGSFYVFVQRDILVAVKPATGGYDFVGKPGTYIVLEA